MGQIDAWARSNAMSRSEVIRRLVETALRDGSVGAYRLIVLALESLLAGLSRCPR
jgi:hypothetical protein